MPAPATDPKTIVVTGAAGALGTRASRELVAAGHRVVGLCLNLKGRPGVHTVDLAAPPAGWSHLLAGADAVIHLAADPSPRKGWPEAQSNVALTRHLLEAARIQGVKRVIYASSNWVMAGHRFRGGPIAEDQPVSPLTPYGVGKYVGEELGRAYAEAGFLEFVALRIGYLPADGRGGKQLNYGAWGQEMWLAPEDFCAAMRHCVAAPLPSPFVVINLMSNNPGTRWSLAAAKAALGFAPTHGAAPTIRLAHRLRTRAAHATVAAGNWLERLWIQRRW